MRFWLSAFSTGFSMCVTKEAGNCTWKLQGRGIIKLALLL